MCFDCLAHCGLRDGTPGWGKFCIDKMLGHALAGRTGQGLFFRGAGRLPFGREIRPVLDLMQWLLGGCARSLKSGARRRMKRDDAVTARARLILRGVQHLPPRRWRSPRG